MRTIEEIRRLQLKALVEEAGSAAALNRIAGRNERDSTISQILNQSPGTSGKPKELGSTLARDLEIAMRKPRGWMDNDPAITHNRWPFKEITPEQFAMLSEIEQGKIEERIGTLLDLKTEKSDVQGKAA